PANAVDAGTSLGLTPLDPAHGVAGVEVEPADVPFRLPGVLTVSGGPVLRHFDPATSVLSTPASTASGNGVVAYQIGQGGLFVAPPAQSRPETTYSLLAGDAVETILAAASGDQVASGLLSPDRLSQLSSSFA